VGNVAEQSGTLGLAFRTNPTKEITVSEESPSIQEISRHVATLITRIDSLQSSVNEIKVSMEKLADGHTTTREFQAEARRRLDDCAADRRDLWNKINDIRDRELKEIRDKVDDARAEASTAMERTLSLSMWLRVACAAYGALLLALFVAALHR
jgi:chromosome segregation ATPase